MRQNNIKYFKDKDISTSQFQMSQIGVSEKETKELNVKEKKVRFTEDTKAPAEKKKTIEEIMKDPFSFEMDRHFLSWLQQQNVSLLVSSYKANQVYAIGREFDPNANEWKIAIFMTTYKRPMGLYVRDNSEVYLSTLNSLWKNVNIGELKDTESGIKNAKFDSVFMPRISWITNDVDAHDIVVDNEGQCYFISPSYSCVAKPSNKYSFELVWKPDWVDRVAREDRCHLNGMSLRDGKLRYVSAVAKTNVRHGWREKNRAGSGLVIDVENNEIVCEGLTMPHSPRWYNGVLYLLNAGCGEFGFVDLEKKTFVAKTFIAGFLRGLDFVNDRYAVIGSSMDRHEKTFSNLPLGKRLEENNVDAICGIHVVDLKTFDIIHEVTFTGGVIEIYDVGVLHDVRRPKILGVYDELVNIEHSLKTD